jgi:GMP synthase (glutamine-hydrolysing)
VRPLVLVLQHVECEDLGTLGPILEETLELRVLRAYGDDRLYHRAAEEALREPRYQGLIALGGPMSVYERERSLFLDDSLRLLRAGLQRGVPILGICLGAQLLAHALGAQVSPGRTLGLRKEIGWYPVALSERGKVDPVFHGFNSGERLFHWHGDTFSLPPGAWHLARSGLYPNQAFRWGRWAYGLQFHIEVTAPMVARWVGEYSAELDGLDYVDRAAVVVEAGNRAPRLPVWVGRGTPPRSPKEVERCCAWRCCS